MEGILGLSSVIFAAQLYCLLKSMIIFGRNNGEQQINFSSGPLSPPCMTNKTLLGSDIPPPSLFCIF